MSDREQLFMPSLIVRDISVVDSNGRTYSPADMCDHGIAGVMLVFKTKEAAVSFFPTAAIEAVDVKEVHCTGHMFRM